MSLRLFTAADLSRYAARLLVPVGRAAQHAHLARLLDGEELDFTEFHQKT